MTTVAWAVKHSVLGVYSTGLRIRIEEPSTINVHVIEFTAEPRSAISYN